MALGHYPMTAILQLHLPLHVVTPKGEGWARFTVFVVDPWENRVALNVER
jgi:hypothetical protein